MKIGKFDITRFKEFYQFGKEINLGDIRNLIGSLESKSFGKRELLITEGSKETQVFFIRKGIVRCFIVNDKGEEITFRLIADNEILVNVDTLLWNQPSRFFYETLEPTSTMKIDYDLLISIVEKHPSIERNRKFVFQKMMQQAHTRLESFVLLTPEERYLKYASEHKDIVNRVADKHIANILGITPTSLSRIRGRIAKEGS